MTYFAAASLVTVLTLILNSAANTSVGEDDLLQTSPSRLPACHQESCIVAEQNTTYLFSALFDATLGEVHVFADMYQELMERETVDFCVFYRDSTADTPGTEVAIPAVAERIVENYLQYTSYVIRCRDPTADLQGFPDRVSLIINSVKLSAQIPVEQVSLEVLGHVGACVAPIFDPQVDLIDKWLKHMSRLGVQRFYFYYMRKPARWKDGKLTLTAQRHRPSNSIVHHPRAEWTEFESLSGDERWYLHQSILYSDCAFRHRHNFQYMMALDTDEFLILKSETQDGGLVPFLKKHFPANSASISLGRWSYRAGCADMQNTSSSDPWHARFSARRDEPDNKGVILYGHNLTNVGDKVIFRPLAVDLFFHHFLERVREPYPLYPDTIQPTTAFIKHLRRYHGSDDCQQMVFSDPTEFK